MSYLSSVSVAALVTLVTMTGLTGCAATQTQATRDIEPLFYDQGFSAQVIPAVNELFVLPPDAINEVKRGFERQKMMRTNPLPANEWLAQHINASDGGFIYRDNYTRLASQTYADREGNCMSLVMLTAALAQVLNVDTEFQDIAVQPVWDRQGGFYLINGHVNLRLLPTKDNNVFHVSSQAILVDFLPERAERGYKKTKIDKTTLMAMFYNNLAAESLIVADYDKAYYLAKAAIQLQPAFVPSLNTLAVIYRAKGFDARAEQLYRFALNTAPEDMTTLYNLALMLGSQDRLEEWAEVHKVLELARIRNPYYYYDMAQQAYSDAQFQDALAWYQRAIDKADYRHEFYFGMSRAYWATGDRGKAKQSMEKALALTHDDNNRRIYQAKLHAMQSH